LARHRRPTSASNTSSGLNEKALTIAFDLPSQIGYDSDAPQAKGSVGKVGVAIDSIEDMHALFDGIPVQDVSVAMTINSTAPIILAFYLAMAQERGIDLGVLQGTTQNDILKEYVARGTYIFPVRPSLRLTTDLIEHCFHHVPKWNTLSITGVHMREAGATAVQEVAFALAHAIVYIESALERGLNVDEFAPRLSYSLGCYRDLFEEVAKFRAAQTPLCPRHARALPAQRPALVDVSHLLRHAGLHPDPPRA
jgi:methylmalonyl-CoA mutase, N-terminal domain